MKWYMGALVMLLVAIISLAGNVSAQSDLSGPSFEVASVKPSEGNSSSGVFNVTNPNRVRISGQPLQRIIGLAYGFQLSTIRYRVQGGPDRVMSATFDIEATTTEPSTAERNQLMVRRLLVERFGLRTHLEKRPTPVYVITAPRNGRLERNIRPSRFDCPAFIKAGGKINDPDAPKNAMGQSLCWASMFDRNRPGVVVLQYAGPFTEFINRIQGLLDKPVVDESGFTGLYEWELTFARNPERTPGAPSVFDAFEDQLGIKLESRTAPYEVLVIDNVQMPTPN